MSPPPMQGPVARAWQGGCDPQGKEAPSKAAQTWENTATENGRAACQRLVPPRRGSRSRHCRGRHERAALATGPTPVFSFATGANGRRRPGEDTLLITWGCTGREGPVPDQYSPRAGLV